MKNVPKLRFNGFSDEWEVKKLDEVTTYVDYRGKTPPKTEKGIFLVTAKNIKMGYIDYNVSQEFIAKESYKESMRRGLPKIGDVLLTTEAPLGNVAQVDRDDIALAQRVIKFRGIEGELNNAYLKQYFISGIFQNALMNKAIGTTVLGIQGKVLHKMLIKFPSMEEQEKIASFLTKVDRLIEKQDEKVSNLEQYKKGMMQKIFSQEIRFKKADGGEYPEWEKEHLGNIVERVARKNKGNITKRPLTISAQYGLVDQEEFFNKVVASANLEGYYLLNKGEFAYNKSYSNGYPFGAIKRLDRYDSGAVSTLYICFMPKENFSSDYLVQYFESDMWHKEVSMVAVEGARNHGLLNISVSDFFETIHKVPCLEEQIKIANFLAKIDSIVDKEKEKLEELGGWKKGLLQQMFI